MKYSLFENGLRVANENKEKTLKWYTNNIVRIYEKKNSEQLVKLSLTEKNTNPEVIAETGKDGEVKSLVAKCNGFEYTIGEDLLVHVSHNGKEYFDEIEPEKILPSDHHECFKLDPRNDEKTLKVKTNISVRLYDGKDIVYGLGDKAASLNRRGYEYESWNTDEPHQHNETYRSLYKSINYCMVNHHNSEYYGFFYPSSYRCVFDLGKKNADLWSVTSEKGEYDYFLIVGNTPAEITMSYSDIVGKTLFTPMKMLGYQQSRWTYTEEEVKRLRELHKQYDMPLDIIHLDIDYMERFKVYTVGKDYDMKALTDTLKKDDIGIITIIDPAVKVEKGYPLYEKLINDELVATYENKPYVNAVWPGDAVYPNYFLDKTAQLITDTTKKFVEENGLTGIWCDMNEPASFNGPLPDDVIFKGEDGEHLHEEVHNLYGEYMAKCVSNAFKKENKRPVVITRAAFATTSQYSTTWNGDNMSLWTHLENSLPQVMTMNLCNFAVNGVDIGGFNCDTTKELLIRWLEADIFSPFLRNHTAIWSKYQEPFAFDEETIKIYRKFLKVRYRFIPYMYDLLHEAHMTGEPVLRPLFYENPLDPRAKQCNDEVMLGKDVLLAPIVMQGATTRAVYLPKGNWINFFTGEKFKGEKDYLFHAEIDETLLFIRCGSVIPMYGDLCHLNKKKIDTVYLYLASAYDEKEEINTEYTMYEDDAETLDYQKGIYNTYLIKRTNEEVSIEMVHSGYRSDYKKMVLVEGEEETEIELCGDVTEKTV